jgi:hypothetical protein
MNQCAQCAQEIPDTATMCDSCRLTALERLFDEVSLNAKQASAASTTPASAAPLANQPADAQSAADQETAMLVPEPLTPAAHVSSPAFSNDALRPPTVEELNELTPQVSAPVTSPSDINGSRAPHHDAASNEWVFPDLNAVRQVPVVSQPSALPIPEIVPAERHMETPPPPLFAEEFPTSITIASPLVDDPLSLRVSEPAAIPSTPIVGEPAKSGIPITEQSTSTPERAEASEPETPAVMPWIAEAGASQFSAEDLDDESLHRPESESAFASQNVDTAPAQSVEASPAPLPAEAVAPAATRRLGARQFALIAVTLVLGGTVTFAMLRASVNRQPDAAAAPVRTDARAPKSSASAKAAKPASTKAAAGNTWTNATRDWAGKERRAAAFEVPSNKKVTTWTRQAQPILVVRCMSKRIDTFVFIESAAQLEPQPNHSVTVRFDDEPASAERWPDSDKHDALFAPDGVHFAERLLAAQTLHFGYRPHNSPSAVVEFNVGGLASLLQPVAKECGMKNAKK